MIPVAESRFLRGTPIDFGWFDAHSFWDKVAIRDPDDCWVWLRAVGTHGYGMVWDGSTMRVAHRVAWVMTYREQVPSGMTIDHLCRNQTCVNPSHMRLLTNSENGRLNGASQRTHCPSGHPYAGDNLYVAPSGDRKCRTCHKQRRLAKRAKAR